MLEISAEHAGGEVVIRVRDDGHGIVPEKIGQVAVERGLIGAEEAANLSVEDAIELLFAPGFSTASETTDISGRGVGMDAVRTMVRNLGGDCHVTSELGKGSCATIRLPLSLAILPALLVEVDGAATPCRSTGSSRPSACPTTACAPSPGAKAIVLRDRILPLHDLGGMLGESDARRSSRRPPSSSTAAASGSASSSTSSSASRSWSPVRFPRSPTPSARSSPAAQFWGMAASP